LFVEIAFLSEYIQTSTNEPTLRARTGEHIQRNKRSNSTGTNHRATTLSNLAICGLAITMGGLVAYLWNQTQYFDANKLLDIGDFL
jgi:hypothetical protein